MDADRSFQPLLRLDEIRVMLRELQGETILLTLPALFVGGFILIASADRLQDPLHGGLPSMILFLLPVAVVALRKPNEVASAWALVLGCAAVILLLVLWADIGAAIYLLADPPPVWWTGS